MPIIDVSARRGAPIETDADTRVVPLFEGHEPSDEQTQAVVKSGEAKTGLGKVAVVHEEGPDGGRRRVILAGMGKRNELDGEKVRVAAAAVAARAKEIGTKALSWETPGGLAAPVVDGTLLKLYEFDRFKSKDDDEDDDDSNGLQSLEIAGEDVASEAVAEAVVAARAVNRARDLQNLPSNVADPEFLAARAREIADGFDALEVEVFDREGIAELGMGAFTAVAQGTYAEPQLIVLRYRGGDSGPHLGYVGKAVTFDTGGISLKPGAKMSEMKFDMSGGAAVLEAMDAIAALGLPVTVLSLIHISEPTRPY